MEDKKNELVSDAVMEGMSNCCGANVYVPNICADCKEPCEVVIETE